MLIMFDAGLSNRLGDFLRWEPFTKMDRLSNEMRMKILFVQMESLRQP